MRCSRKPIKNANKWTLSGVLFVCFLPKCEFCVIQRNVIVSNKNQNTHCLNSSTFWETLISILADS